MENYKYICILPHISAGVWKKALMVFCFVFFFLLSQENLTFYFLNTVKEEVGNVPWWWRAIEQRARDQQRPRGRQGSTGGCSWGLPGVAFVYQPGAAVSSSPELVVSPGQSSGSQGSSGAQLCCLSCPAHGLGENWWQRREGEMVISWNI